MNNESQKIYTILYYTLQKQTQLYEIIAKKNDNKELKWHEKWISLISQFPT